MLRHLFLVLLFFIPFDAFAQGGLGVVYAPSKVIKHRDNLLFDVPDRSSEFRIAYVHKTDGAKDWERYWGKPSIALNLLHVNFGDDVLGDAVAFLPELHFTLKSWDKLKLNLQFGTGMAYITKPFDAISNPRNNAIGSNMNNTSSLKFGLDYSINQDWSASVSTGIVHFSNGLSSSPNAGINIYGLSFGVVKHFGVKYLQAQDRRTDIADLDSSSYRKWIFDVQYHYGVSEQSTPGGPKFGVYALNLAAGYRYTKYMTAYLGAEYEFNDGTYTFLKESFFSDEEASKIAKSTIIYAEHELRFGAVFNRFRLGYYLPYPSENPKTLYIKTVTGVYLPKVYTTRPYVGVLLKTHAAVADYIGVVFGVSI